MRSGVIFTVTDSYQECLEVQSKKPEREGQAEESCGFTKLVQPHNQEQNVLLDAFLRVLMIPD